METPLTPLEFARRARKLYPERVAVIRVLSPNTGLELASEPVILAQHAS